MKNVKKILVLGIGNILLTDEGIGVRAVEFLQTQIIPSEVELIDGGTAGFDLLDIIADRKSVIVVDAVDCGKPAGTIVRFTEKDIETAAGGNLSIHHLNFGQVLQLAKTLNCAPPQVVIIGVQPASLAPGLELSKTIAPLVPKIAKLVTEEINIILSAPF